MNKCIIIRGDDTGLEILGWQRRSRFGVRNNEMGDKIKNFGSIPTSNYEVLKYMLMPNGRDYSQSSYLRDHSWLKDMKYDWEEQKNLNYLHIDPSIEPFYPKKGLLW